MDTLHTNHLSPIDRFLHVTRAREALLASLLGTFDAELRVLRRAGELQPFELEQKREECDALATAIIAEAMKTYRVVLNRAFTDEEIDALTFHRMELESRFPGFTEKEIRVGRYFCRKLTELMERYEGEES